MKKKKMFKSRLQMIIYMILFAICIALFIVIGRIDFHKDEVSEASKISKIYNSLDENNLYVFSDATDVLNIINKRTGIILMGFPSNKFMDSYAHILNKAAMEYNIDKIYYYDFLQDREENNGTYETIVRTLEVYAPQDDLGIQNIYAPTIIMVKEGTVVAYLDDAAILKGNITPEIYYNDNQEAIIYEKIKTAIKEYLG